MKTIKFNTFLFGIIGILIGCHTKNENSKVSKNDSIKTITKKTESPKTTHSKNCNCDENHDLKDYISCEETVFSNGAKIYRQFNCDSSWLVFENKKIKKSIFSLDKDLIELTGRLGYVEWDEYKNSILVETKVISGCCQPYEYDLIDKENGSLIKKLGKDIYISQSNSNPIFASLDTQKPKINFYNLSTRKSASIDFNFNKIDVVIKSGFMRYPEELFENGSIVNGIFKIKYRYKLKENEVWKFENITIDLNKVDFN
ncbi:MAG: hypothetical protein V4666_10120 [Bacteroidota bacterium]